MLATLKLKQSFENERIQILFYQAMELHTL